MCEIRMNSNTEWIAVNINKEWFSGQWILGKELPGFQEQAANLIETSN